MFQLKIELGNKEKNDFDIWEDDRKKLHYFETCFSLSLLSQRSLLTESSGSNEISRKILDMKIDDLGLDNEYSTNSILIPNLFEFYQQCLPLMNNQNTHLLEDTELNLFKLLATKKRTMPGRPPALYRDAMRLPANSPRQCKRTRAGNAG